ncbi:MAG: hypothetical protein LBQ62_00170 [Candidatus Accumulibacter sp.]|jgi:hypothetical protein|nr:hypothetical protein [Accumulibacter sp.]
MTVYRRIIPISLREAAAFVNAHHRHNVGARGHKFSIGLSEDGILIGVATVGRPIARAHDDGLTAEVTRCCVIEGKANANSMLYGAAWRAAKGMGYTRLITYTLPEESGASLRAAGFVENGRTRPDTWDRPKRKRAPAARYPEGEKIRWLIQAAERKR